MVIPSTARGATSNRAEINWELTSPGISVSPPLSVPPLTVTGGNSPEAAQSTPRRLSACTSTPTGLLAREGPATSRHWPGTTEHIAVKNRRVAAESPQNRSVAGTRKSPPETRHGSFSRRVVIPISCSTSAAATVSSAVKGCRISLSPPARAAHIKARMV